MIRRQLKSLAVAMVLVAICGSAARAAAINYGNFGPVAPGFTFLQVVESSTTDAVPLYGPPVPFPVGLDFNPVGFASSAAGGVADITEGQLNFSVSSALDIQTISVLESGDYTLTGTGTSATSALAGAIVRVTVTQINGVAVAPINLIPVNASVSFSLPPNAGIAQPWSLGMTLNIRSQLNGLGYGPGSLATRVDVVVNNTLASSSQSSTAASIAKKDFQIVIPEPATLSIAGLALSTLALSRRRK